MKHPIQVLAVGFVLATVLSCAIAAAENPDATTQKEFQRMAGRWLQGIVNWKSSNPTIARMIYGREFDQQDPLAIFQNRATLMVREGEFTFGNGRFTRKVKVTIDPAKQPKAIDFQLDGGQQLAGIYSLEKEWLKIAINGGAARPAGFEAKDGEPPDFVIHFQSAKSLMFPAFELAYQYDLPGLLTRQDVRAELGMAPDGTNLIERTLAPVRKNYDQEVERIGDLPPAESQPKFKLAREAIRKEMVLALEKALKPAQMRRLRQLHLQQREIDALFDLEVQATLGITKEQAAEIRRAGDQAMQGMAGKGPVTLEVFEEARNQRKEKMLAALTEAQRKQWHEMVGEPFALDQAPTKGK